jgi:hypothetical protein
MDERVQMLHSSPTVGSRASARVRQPGQMHGRAPDVPLAAGENSKRLAVGGGDINSKWLGVAQSAGVGHWVGENSWLQFSVRVKANSDGRH